LRLIHNTREPAESDEIEDFDEEQHKLNPGLRVATGGVPSNPEIG
jgi:hypothetical protein